MDQRLVGASTNSVRGCGTTVNAAVSARAAITPATSRPSQAVPVPNTPRAVNITETLLMVSLRLHSRTEFMLASPSRQVYSIIATPRFTARASRAVLWPPFSRQQIKLCRHKEREAKKRYEQFEPGGLLPWLQGATSVKQQGFPFLTPSGFVQTGQGIQAIRHGGGVVHPLP